MKYRSDVDGLRAIAVLSVVFFHAFPQLVPGGFVGVDVFFVLSGFLISNILFSQMAKGSINWTEFYLKRIKRIFPALLLVLFSAILIGYFLLFPVEYENLGKHLIGSSSFINNFVLWREAGYFDKASELKPLLHLWSLGIEEQFYLIWPMFVFFIWKLRFNPLIILILFSVISFAINLAWVTHHNIRAFYFPFSRFWELSLGATLAYLMFKNKNWFVSLDSKKFISNCLSFIALLFLTMSIFFFSEHLAYPGWAALLPTLCTLILLFTQNSWVNRNFLSFRIITFVGLISYPLYLWHWELLSFGRIVYAGAVSPKLTLILVSMSFILAYLTYQWIEKPIRFSVTAEKYPRYIASALCSGLIIIGLGGFIIQNNQGLEHRVIAYQNQTLIEDIGSFDEFRKQVVPCQLATQKKDLKEISWCLQNKKGKPQKVLWGDSHAEHLFPGILKSDKETNWLLLEQSGCPPLLNVASYWKGSSDKCIKANNVILEAIINTPSIDTVVLASLGSFYISDTSYAAASQGDFAADKHFLTTNDTKKSKRDVFFDGINKTINELKKAGKKVVLFQDIPEIPFMPERCIHRPLAPKQPCFITTAEVMARQNDYVSLLQHIRIRQKIPLFDPIHLVCNKKMCPLVKNHHLIYRDSHHLSLAGSELIAENLIPWINKNT